MGYIRHQKLLWPPASKDQVRVVTRPSQAHREELRSGSRLVASCNVFGTQKWGLAKSYSLMFRAIRGHSRAGQREIQVVYDPMISSEALQRVIM